MHDTPRTRRRIVSLALLVAVAVGFAGCAARSVRSPIINRWGVQVDLVREVKGFSTQPRGYEHPTIISKERMTHILNAIEVETRDEEIGVVREPAFHPEIVERTAEALVDALAEANPDQEVGVQALRKQMQLGVFHRKFLTSFLAYVKDGHLYLLLNRVDWKIPQKMEEERLPKPRRSYAPMNFRVVSGEHLFYAGPQALEIDWRNDAFRTAYRLPGTTSGERRRREILEQSPIPQDEQDSAAGTSDVIPLDELSSEQLRALADLEDDRREGRITEHAYQRARRQLLRRR
jgi:hypothetical protein